MVERVDQRQLVKQVGGVFRLCSMIQKRMRELVMGARPLVELDEQDRGDLLSIVLHEIQEGKVSVAEEGEVSVDFHIGPSDVAGLADSIDLDELKSVVADDDLDIVLPGEDDDEDEEESPQPQAHAPEPGVAREHVEAVDVEEEHAAVEPVDAELPEDHADEDEDEEEDDEDEDADDDE